MMISHAILPKSFYERDTRVVAFELLGKRLVFKGAKSVFSGMVVETEAYLGSEDPASHAFRGPTPRNRIMFGSPGFSYVYFTYGFHHCFNVTTEREGVAGAVLIRAVEPLLGIDSMKQNRNCISELINLTNGPGKLAQAFGLSREHSGLDLTSNEFHFETGVYSPYLWIGTSSRIGIKHGKEYDYRFFIQDSPYVSKAPKVSSGGKSNAVA